MAASGIFARSGTASANTPIGGIASSNSMTPTQLDDVDRSILAEVFLGLVTRGVDVASASTLDLDGASTPSILHNITGTTATSVITLTAGQYRILRAVGAWPLTAGASLIVNGSTTANYTCTAEDRLLVEGFAAGVVRVTVINPTKTAFAAYRSTNQTMTNNAFTKIQFDTEEFDVGGYYDNATNYRFTPPAGKYVIGGAGNISASNDQGQIALDIYKNGAAFKVLADDYASGTAGMLVAGQCLVEANGTDYFELHLYHATTSDRTLIGDQTKAVFWGYRV